MSQVHLLEQLLIVLTTTLSILFIFQKLRLPTIVGFLLAGVVIGPHGFRLIRSAGEVAVLAEIGVILLLFTIGLEFSFKAILTLHRRIIWAGVLQVFATTGIVALLAIGLGFSSESGVFYGLLVALSSTAIVLRIYNDRREINSIHGRLATGILLLQDLCIIPMMLLVPLLGDSGKGSLFDVVAALLKAIVALVVIVLVSRKLLPTLWHHVALLKNREIFVLFAVLVCLGTAWLTAQAGLSLALGALLAGLVISDSELSHQIMADVLPLRDCFSGIFFISLGMLLNLDLLTRDLFKPLIEILLMVCVKGLVLFVVVWRLYGSLRLAVLIAVSLAQVGEFSFILAQTGSTYHLMSPTDGQIFLAASVLSMLATPFLIQSVRDWPYRVEAVGARSETQHAGDPDDEAQSYQGHVIIVGHGLNGQNLARVLKEVGIPYHILEMDPDLVSSARLAREPILFGDGTRPEILQKAGIQHARVLVVAISDPVATTRVVSQARRLRPDLYLVVRTRYVAELDRLYGLGANQVIPEEFETSVEIFARVLQQYHIPRNVISLQVDLIRKEHYGTLRGLRLEGKRLDQLNQLLAGTTTDIFLILEGSPAIGKTLNEIDLRSRAGAAVIAVVREGKSFQNVGPDFVVRADDMLVLIGDHKALDEAGQIFSPPRDRSE